MSNKNEKRTGRPTLPPEQLLLQYRIQDLALAASMLIAKEEMQSVFPNFVAHERFGFDIRSIAIPNQEEAVQRRSEQIETWKDMIQLRIADLR